MKSLLLLKKLDIFLLLKIMILICQNIRSALWDVKERFCDDKNSDMFCYIYIYISKIFYDKNSGLFYYIFYKRFSKKKTSLII